MDRRAAAIHWPPRAFAAAAELIRLHDVARGQRHDQGPERVAHGKPRHRSTAGTSGVVSPGVQRLQHDPHATTRAGSASYGVAEFAAQPGQDVRRARAVGALPDFPQQFRAAESRPGFAGQIGSTSNSRRVSPAPDHRCRLSASGGSTVRPPTFSRRRSWTRRHHRHFALRSTAWSGRASRWAGRTA